MLMRERAVLLALLQVLLTVSAQALSRISPTEAVAGGPMFTLRGFADQSPFDSDEKTLTWRRAGQPASAARRLRTTKVSSRQLRAEVPAEFIAEPGDFRVGVAGVSRSLPFTVLPPGDPICQIQPGNTYLPTCFLAPHLFNRDGHPPHELGVAVMAGSAPAANVDFSLVTTQPALLDASGNPTLIEMSLQTDADGRAVFEYIPPSQGPFDRTDFEVSGSVNDVAFSCLGTVVTGLGALTASYQGLRDVQDSVALLRQVWDTLLARATLDEYATELSLAFSKQVERIARVNPAFLSRLRKSVKEHRPLLERMAAGEPVTATTGALDDMEALLGYLEPAGGIGLQQAVVEVKGYLARVRQRAKFADNIRPPSSNKRTRSAPQPTRQPETTAPAGPPIRADYDKLRLSFEANKGQAAGDVRYLARGPGYNLYLLPQEAVVVSGLAAHGPSGPPSVVRIQLRGTEPRSKVTGTNQLPGRSHYFLGNDPANWHTDVPHFARVKYEGIYPGVDLIYYGKHHQLEYDFVVAPGASPDRISFGFEGIEGLQLDDRGDLVLNTGGSHFRLKKPFIYQEIAGVRQEVAGRYALREADLVGFEVEDYDSSLPLVIDPILSYSSYAGGGNYDTGLGIAVGSDGSAYVTGATTSSDFPTQNSLQPGSSSGTLVGIDAFVMKLNPNGSDIIYSTYVGGSRIDVGAAIAVDSAGNAYVTGSTQSADFPIVGAVQPALTARGTQAPSSLSRDPSIKDAIRQRAGDDAKNLWQWNYFYEQITGARAPDPFQLVPARPGGGQWAVEEVRTYRLGLDDWW